MEPVGIENKDDLQQEGEKIKSPNARHIVIFSYLFVITYKDENNIFSFFEDERQI